MKSSRYTVIILLMAVSLIALMAVQFFWIKLSLDTEAKQFDNKVQIALKGLGEDLEVSRMFNFFEEAIAVQIGGDSLSSGVAKDSFSVEILMEELLDHRKSRMHEIHKRIEHSDSLRDGNKSKRIIRIEHSHQDSQVADTSISIFLKQADEEIIHLKEQLWSEESMLSIDSLTKEIRMRSGKMNQLIEEMALEYTLATVDVRPDKELIDSLLNSNLKKQNIKSPYTFELFRSDSKTKAKIWSNYPRKHKNYEASLSEKSPLFSSYSILLNVVQRESLIRRGIWPILLMALIFSSLIILTFAYTLRTILRQKKLSEMKNDFINNMTHEFKTPLATMGVALDALETEEIISKPEQIRRFSKVIRDEKERMNEQVDQVLSAAKEQSSAMSIKLESFNLNHTLKEAVEQVRLQVEARNGEIVLEGEQEINVLADQEHLKRVFSNVLDNANKYSGDRPQIEVRMVKGQGAAIVEIRDQGIGMDRQTQKRVFEQFYRKSTGDLHNVKGFGLGLAYVRSALEAMNSHISLKSQLGKGSSFRIVIPLAT